MDKLNIKNIFILFFLFSASIIFSEDSPNYNNTFGINFLLSSEISNVNIKRGISLDYSRKIASFFYYGLSIRVINKYYTGITPYLSLNIPLNKSFSIPFSLGVGIDINDLLLSDTSFYGQISLGIKYNYDRNWSYYGDFLYNHEILTQRSNIILVKLGVKYNF